ncbi:MAG: hypothetical protein EYC67_08555 [Betaproteobacteria bacterium]|nr:MAG: hypothetical protein EYC67_08555 [Betaproteobacteria bacterium]
MNALHVLTASLILGAASIPAPTAAADRAVSAASIEGADAARASALLDRAEAYFREHGEQALATFSRMGEFQDGDLYVYVLGLDGTVLASGGSSATLIGRNVRDMTDSSGRPFFREIIEGARTRPSGRVEYRWRNPVRDRDEPKIATYRLVGDRVLVVGYYMAHASLDLAKSLVWRAVHELRLNDVQAFERFNSLNGGFVQDDLYVFVIGLDDGIMHANGGHPRLVGRKVGELVDANGKYFVRDMLALARNKGEGEVDYAWRNPIGQKIEKKRAYVVRVGRYLVGSGAYFGPAR